MPAKKTTKLGSPAKPTKANSPASEKIKAEALGRMAHAIFVRMAGKATPEEMAARGRYEALPEALQWSRRKHGAMLKDVAGLLAQETPTGAHPFPRDSGFLPLTKEEEFAAKVSNDVSEDIDCGETRAQLREVIRTLGMMHVDSFGRVRALADAYLTQWAIAQIEMVRISKSRRGASARKRKK
jgi:hypothetical protein